MDKTGAKDKEELHREIMERYAYAKDRWSETYDLAREDRKFNIPGGQWDEQMRAARENDPLGARPCLESPRIEQYLRQVINDARQNTPQIKFRPTNYGSSQDVAEILNDIVRSDQDASNADTAFDQSLEDGVRSSFGFFRMLSDYEDDSSMNQRVRFKCERNPMAITIDPDFVEMDASDIRYAFVESSVPRKRFEKDYPDAELTEFSNDSEGWISDESIRICEYYWIEDEPETLYFDMYGKPTVKDAPGAVSRESVKKSVKWCKLNGKEILEEADVAGEFIPVIPTFGRMIDVDGKLNLISLARPAMDAQRMYNYASSAMTERVTLSPKNKILAERESVEGQEHLYRSAHTSNDPLLTYDSTSALGQPLQPPRMIEGQSNPSQWVALMQHANNDIQAAMGLYNSSLGAKSNETSGKAIMARQREGDVSTFDFIDNLSRAVRLSGKVWLKMFVSITDTRREIRTISEDGKVGTVIFDPDLPVAYKEIEGPNGEPLKVINPTIGQYDVTVVSGPSFSTKRDEAANFYTEVIRSSPATAPALLPIMLQNMDTPGADKAVKVLKAMLPPNIQAAMDGDDGKLPQIPPQVQAQMQQMEQVIQQMQQALQDQGAKVQEAELQVQEAEARAQRMMLESANKAQDVQLKAAIELSNAERDTQNIQINAYKAETERMKAVQAGMTPEQVQAMIVQTMIDLSSQQQGAVTDTEEPDGFPELNEGVSDDLPLQV